MEKKFRLILLLRLLVFSGVVFTFSLQSCGEKEYREDYSFRNELNEDIILTVYSSDSLLKEVNEKEVEIESMEQSLLLVNVSDHFRNGAGANYISQLTDSVSVTIKNTNELIVFWRKVGQHYYADNYSNFRDIFNANEAPWQYRSIGNNYVEYYYLLKIEIE